MLEKNDAVEVKTENNTAVESSKQKESKKARKGNHALDIDAVRTRFTSCGRCSLFLAAYRIINDDQILETAVANSDGHWLALPWDQQLRKLIIKSYGCRLDSDIYYFESSCPECLGKFRYTEPDTDEPPFLYFKI